MRTYEGFFILTPEASEEGAKKQLKGIESLISKYKGKIAQTNDLGKKPLGYTIQKHHEGHWVVYDYDMEPSEMKPFRKALELQESVLSFILTKKQPEAPAPAPAKRAPAASKPKRAPRSTPSKAPAKKA